jgi:Domain of unknown function (DUF222)
VCTDTVGAGYTSVAEALRTAEAAMDFLNSPAAAELPGDACGDALIALGRIQAKHAAAHAEFLRRFDAADAHDADGYGSSSAWLAAKGQLAKKDARAAVREMRRQAERPLLAAALKAGEITQSWAGQLADWTRKLPAGMRAETDRILLDAAAAGASLDDLATIAACAIERWRQQQPDPDDPDGAFEDRSVRLGVTFGGAAVLRGSLTPECASAVRAVLESLGKKAGPEDDRTEEKRFHDALQLACQLLLRARLVPDRAGADTMVIAHVPLSQLRQMPGAGDLEDAWIRARTGEDGYLTGKDAETAACDAPVVPVVTGTVNPDVIDQMINLARTAAEASTPTHPVPHESAKASTPTPPVLDDPAEANVPAQPAPGQPAETSPPGPEASRLREPVPADLAGTSGTTTSSDTSAQARDSNDAGKEAPDPDGGRRAAGSADADRQAPGSGNGRRPPGQAGPAATVPGQANRCPAALSPEAWRALRYGMARLAVELVSGPAGVAAVLRGGLLDKPYNTPSLPLDIGYSKSIPPAIRRAVLLRDRTCAWPQCDRPAAHGDIHHLRHQADGGETSIRNCILLCQYHHDVCIHRRGWQLTLHPDGTTQARSPDGRRVLHSHAPSGEQAA